VSTAPRLHLVLFNPEIPQNTGNVGRLCAWTDCRLHLIRPLGFTISDRHLRRSGMDYWHHLDLHIHDDWAAFTASPHAPARWWLFTTHASRTLWQAPFAAGDGLVFGNEGHGAPPWLHDLAGDERRLRIPSFASQPLRSLNLSTAVGIAAYEAIRQTLPNGG
jgi:tRNA (cytidine/uridine-2'-O-)-methyltransferase